MASGPKSKLRRDEIRRRTQKSESYFKRMRREVGFASPAIALGFWALCTFVILYARDPFPYYVGQELRRPIYSRVHFKITDEEATRQSRLKGRQETPNYYTLNDGLIKRVSGMITNLYNIAQQYDSYEAYLDAKEQAGEQAPVEERWKLDERAYHELHALADETGQARFSAWVEQLAQRLKRERLVRRGDDDARSVLLLSRFAVLKGAVANENDEKLDEAVQVDKVTLNYFWDTNIKNVQRTAEELSAIFPAGIRDRIRSILVDSLSEEPLFRFDLESTLAAMDAEAASLPEVKTIYRPFQVLAQPQQEDKASTDVDTIPASAAAGGLFKLTGKQADDLEVEHAKYNELISAPLENISEEEHEMARTLRRMHRFKQVGRGALVFLITLGMVVYCGMFQYRVIRNPVRALSIAVLFLIMVALARMSYLGTLTVRLPYVTVALVVMTAAILTIVYSQRFALGLTAALALLITLTIRGSLPLVLVLGAAMAVAVYQLREIRSRHELLSTGILNFLAAFIVTLVVVLVEGFSAGTAVQHALSAAGAAFAAITVFFVMLPVIESVFRVVTNMTLLDLLDTSQPLLVRLAREAPGTYAHSLWLATMAENACDAIGANPLLAKVGAMYHDIGKVHKAEYFAENQEAQINRHDKLSPTMSLLVIIGHVKDGVELAKEQSLPPAVIRFIEEHHGTTLVRYFHHVASEKQKAAGIDREVSDTEFRYPGPKPQSKETAVLMMCDGVEGAVRALQEPTAGRIENVVHNVLMDRLTDGQFNDCDITLKELHRAEESLVKTLCGFYHRRVVYPKSASRATASDRRTEREQEIQNVFEAEEHTTGPQRTTEKTAPARPDG